MMILYGGAVLALVAVMLGVPALLGERHGGRGRAQPFESGIDPVGSARLRFPVKFFRLAVFFVIFDIEAVFLFAWAVAARDTGWAGLIGATVFIVALLAALAYLWRLGGLDWGPRPCR